MSCHTHCLVSGQVPTLRYGRPFGHVLNEISNTSRCNQPANIRYSLTTKHQQMKKCDNRSSPKKTVQPCIIMLHNNLRPALTT